MLLDQNSELQLRATRPKPLIISILAHILLIALIAFNPDWFETTPHRVIRIAGEDFDLSQLELRQLTLPPRMPRPAPAPRLPAPAPAPVPEAPLIQPQQAAPPPPPPPPPPTPAQPPPPDRIIGPDDLLVEGARPDGSPRASRGDTRDQARAGGPQAQEAQEAQQAQQAQRGQQGRSGTPNRGERGSDRILPNMNPNAIQTPSLLSEAGRIVDEQLGAARRSGAAGRTGIVRGDNNGTYSTDPQILSPVPKGFDYGPYLNQLLSRLRANWYSVMPEMARLGQQGRVDIVFSVSKSGIVKDLQLIESSRFAALDKGAIAAIQLSNPFQQLPPELEPELKLRIAFLYNMYP